jgi:hypothetical protein
MIFGGSTGNNKVQFPNLELLYMRLKFVIKQSAYAELFH